MFVQKSRLSTESALSLITSTMKATQITGACANRKQKCWDICHGGGKQVMVPFFLNSYLIFLSLSIVFMNVSFSTLSQMVCNTSFANHLTCWTSFKCMCFFIELFNTQSFQDFLVLTLTFIIASEEKNYALHVLYFYSDLPSAFYLV